LVQRFGARCGPWATRELEHAGVCTAIASTGSSPTVSTARAVQRAPQLAQAIEPVQHESAQIVGLGQIAPAREDRRTRTRAASDTRPTSRARLPVAVVGNRLGAYRRTRGPFRARFPAAASPPPTGPTTPDRVALEEHQGGRHHVGRYVAERAAAAGDVEVDAFESELGAALVGRGSS
jgi:hypothetical protein